MTGSFIHRNWVMTKLCYTHVWKMKVCIHFLQYDFNEARRDAISIYFVPIRDV